MTTQLFEPYAIKDLELPNRVVMAPMTRNRADDAGVPYLANPDLPERLRQDAPLNPPDMDTSYGGDERGYTDYATLA